MMHEISHNYVSPGSVIPNLGPHWMYTGTGEQGGMLGGWPTSAATCSNPEMDLFSQQDVDTCSSGKMVFDMSEGAAGSSNDLSGSFADVELYMFGLMTEAEFLAKGGGLTYCEQDGPANPSNTDMVPIYVDGQMTHLKITCTNGIDFVSAADVVSKWKGRSSKGKLVTKGSTLNIAVVYVYPDQASVPTSASEYNAYEEWAVQYFGDEGFLPSKFSERTNNLAQLSFSVSQENGTDETTAPTKSPTKAPTKAPTNAPTDAPGTDAPRTAEPITEEPTEAPTEAPATETPTGAPGNDGALPACAYPLGDAACACAGPTEFDAGWGKCDTYATHKSNAQYCSHDKAEADCAECGKCSMPTGTAAASAASPCDGKLTTWGRECQVGCLKPCDHNERYTCCNRRMSEAQCNAETSTFCGVPSR